MTRRNVYVVDDDPALLHSLGTLLDWMGYQFLPFADPRDFLAAAADLSPGCVVTDLRMPGMDGFELQRAMQDQAISWPVILITSECDEFIRDRALSSGFSAFLCKPFSSDELAQALVDGFDMLEPKH